MSDLVIELSEISDRWISMTVHGEVDLATAGELSRAIDDVFTDGSSSLVVDLSATGFMDSTGLKTLIMAERRFAEVGRELALAVRRGPVSRLIDLAGVDSSVRVVPDATDVLDGG